MKYIAFEGTPNEQMWDSGTRIVTWANGQTVEDCRPVLTNIWRRVGEGEDATANNENR